MAEYNFPSSKMFNHNFFDTDTPDLRNALRQCGATIIEIAQIDKIFPNKNLKKRVLDHLGVCVGMGTVVKGVKISHPLDYILNALGVKTKLGTEVVTLLDSNKENTLDEMSMLEALGHIGSAISAIALLSPEEILQ